MATEMKRSESAVDYNDILALIDNPISCGYLHVSSFVFLSVGFDTSTFSRVFASLNIMQKI